MTMYGNRMRVQAYVSPEIYEKINAVREIEKESMSGFLGSVLELIFNEEESVKTE
jgi:hypothetical protein